MRFAFSREGFDSLILHKIWGSMQIGKVGCIRPSSERIVKINSFIADYIWNNCFGGSSPSFPTNPIVIVKVTSIF